MNADVLLVSGILLCVMIALWILNRKKRNASGIKDFDEMQTVIRGRGYRIGFLTAVILLAVMILLSELDALKGVTAGFAFFAVLIISVTTFGVYCVAHDAFLGIREKPKRTMILFLIIVVVDGAVSVINLISGKMTESGRLNFSGGSSVLMFAAFLILLITLIVKTAKGRKEAAE